MHKAPTRLACDLLIFDLDGTLIDSQQDLVNSVNATLFHLHRTHLQPALVSSFIGDGAAMLVQRALDATGGCSDEAMAQAMPFFLDYYRSHNLDHTAAYPGVVAALRQIKLQAPGLPMAILTNKPVRPSRAICNGLGLTPFFFANYGSDSFARKKPDPMGIHSLMGEAGEMLQRTVDPRQAVLVGDSHVDVETAHAAGILCLGCTYGLDTERMLAAKPHATAASPDEWLPALQRMLA